MLTFSFFDAAEIKLPRLFPRERGSPKMTVTTGFPAHDQKSRSCFKSSILLKFFLLSIRREITKAKPVNGTLHVQIVDDFARSEVEIVSNDCLQVVIGDLGGSIREDGDVERLGDADGVRQLDQNAPNETGFDQGQRHPSSGICG